MRRVELDINAIDDLAWFVQNDPKLAARLIRLLKEAAESPFSGLGKPEPLRGQLSGCWSRRLNQEHRIVYKVSDERVLILSCRFHYER